MTGRIFTSMNPDCRHRYYHLCGASHSLLDAAARHGRWAAIYALALLLSRRRIPFARGSDYQQNGAVIWDDVDREFDCHFGPAFTDCRGQFSGTVRAPL